jgi:DNA polymerase (family 10)
MGDKAVEKIRQSLEVVAQGQTRVPLGLAHAIAGRVLAVVRKQKGVIKAEAAGSLRRGKETVGDLDIIACMHALDAQAASTIMQAFATMPGVQRVLVQGEFKSSLLLAIAEPEAVAGDEHPHEKTDAKVMQVDLRVVPASSFGATLQYFTGSKEHNVRLRAIAQSKGLTLNEWGLFDDAVWKSFHEQGAVTAARRLPAGVVDASEEASIYAQLGCVFVPPEMREDRGEFGSVVVSSGGAQHAGKLDAAQTSQQLVRVADVRSELHSHTTASDGVLSIEQLARAAHARGFHTIAVTDHSQSSTIARGLKPDRLRTHIKAVREVHAKLHAELGISVLAGSEVDILADGSLDYSDELLAQLDVVVASPHAALKQEPAAATKRLLKAIEHPLVHIIGHPTGRIVNQRAGLEPAMHELIAAAREKHVALEVNSHWARLDLRDVHVRQTIEAGCTIAINCDVHHPDDFDNLLYGVATARRGWATKDRVLNTWDAQTLHAWLALKR